MNTFMNTGLQINRVMPLNTRSIYKIDIPPIQTPSHDLLSRRHQMFGTNTTQRVDNASGMEMLATLPGQWGCEIFSLRFSRLLLIRYSLEIVRPLGFCSRSLSGPSRLLFSVSYPGYDWNQAVCAAFGPREALVDF